jgi:glycosyltransferase involved in cell wall biosynthesis
VRILFLTCHLPYPPVSGGRRREFELLKRLGRDYDIRLVCVSKTYDEDVANAGELAAHCRSVAVFAAELVEDPQLAPQCARHVSGDCAAYIEDLVASEGVDAIHVEGFYLMQHVPRSAAPVLLVDQNVEYLLYRQRATERGLSRAERKRASHDAELTRGAEWDAWGRSDVIGAVSSDDLRYIRNHVHDRPVVLLPDGVDHLDVVDDEIVEPVGPLPVSPSLVFVGNFAYQPNIDAAAHLVRDILPRIRARIPDVELWLVGNDPAPDVRALAGDGVTVTGRVPSVIPYIEAADVFVCPLRIGGGIKVKLLEAASIGAAIATTSVGVQGFPECTCHAFVVEDDDAKYARRVAQLLTHPRERDALAAAARDLARGLPTWEDAAARVARCYEELIPPATIGRHRLRGSGAVAAS